MSRSQNSSFHSTSSLQTWWQLCLWQDKHLSTLQYLASKNAVLICLFMSPSQTVLDNLKSGLIFWFNDKCFFQKAVFVNLSTHVWIIFHLNFKTFFCRYMISLYLPINVICYFGGWLQNYLTTPKAFQTSIVKLGNHCTLKLQKATKALFMRFFSCHLSLKVPHD